MIDWLSALAPYQDYGWFIALITWSAAVIAGRRTVRDTPGWVWLPWAAWPGVAVAFVELVSFARPPTGDMTNLAPHLPEDILIGLLTAATVSGWIWNLNLKRPARIALVFGCLAAAASRYYWPLHGANFVALTGTVVALVYARATNAPRESRIAILVMAAALWLSSTGPLASGGLQLRRWADVGPWSVVWSGAQAVAGVVALIGTIAPWFANPEGRREWRPFLVASIAWILFGLGLAATMSSWARRAFEAQTLGRARAASALIDKEDLARLLDPSFQITNYSRRQRREGTWTMSAKAPRLTSPAAKETRHQLGLVEKADPDILWAYLQTARAGWMVIFTSDRYPVPPGGLPDYIGLSTPTSYDLLDWSEKRGRFLPLILEWASRSGSGFKVRAPLVTDDGRMLGWLILNFPMAHWVAAQAQPRVMAYLIVFLGLGLAGLVAIQRVRTRERETARAAATAAEQAGQLKTAFLAKVSHELRTPIQSVLGYSDLLRSAVVHPVAQQRLAALRQHGELMLRLVNDLLDLSAMQAGSFRLVEKPAALGDLIRQTVESLRPQAELKGLFLSVTVDPGTPAWAKIDAERVRQVVLNLAGNAIKFTDKGQVGVALQVGRIRGEVALVVSDTGPGIKAEDRARLFQPFSRLDATVEKEGTGLGLALVAALCRGMGGDIAEESEPGAGAMFRARFRAPACEVPPEIDAPSVPRGLLSGRRVLIADDNTLVRELFAACLQEAGADWVAVGDGEAALATAKAGHFDAVILDLAMPRLGGIEVARHLKQQKNSRLKIIGVSAHAGDRERVQAIEAGMDVFLVKPVSLDALVEALLPPAPPKLALEHGWAGMRERLQERFRGLAGAEKAGLSAAIEAGDLELVRTRAHHLMNSAIVVGDDALYEACTRVENAAAAGEKTELAVAWQACLGALEPWTQ